MPVGPMSWPSANEYCWVSAPPIGLSSVRIHEHSMVGVPVVLLSPELPPPIVALTPIPLTELFVGPWAKALPMESPAIVVAAMSMVAPLAHRLLGALSCIGFLLSLVLLARPACGAGPLKEAKVR